MILSWWERMMFKFLEGDMTLKGDLTVESDLTVDGDILGAPAADSTHQPTSWTAEAGAISNVDINTSKYLQIGELVIWWVRADFDASLDTAWINVPLPVTAIDGNHLSALGYMSTIMMKGEVPNADKTGLSITRLAGTDITSGADQQIRFIAVYTT